MLSLAYVKGGQKYARLSISDFGLSQSASRYIDLRTRINLESAVEVRRRS
jgi:hypothetical protein